MTKNRYDRLNEAGDAAKDAQILSDEWIQAPDGSWIRSSDKAARKLSRKPKRKSDDEAPDAAPAAAATATAAAPAEPRRWFGRKNAAEREAEAEKDRQAEAQRAERAKERAEREREAEFDRHAERERTEKAELERQIELERRAELDRRAEQEKVASAERERAEQLERFARVERERKADLERKAEQERARAAELEREIELERAHVAELEREVEQERQRQTELARTAEQERQRKTELTRTAELERKRQAELELEVQAELDQLGYRSNTRTESEGTYWRSPDSEPEPSYSRWQEAEPAAADPWSNTAEPAGEPRPYFVADPEPSAEPNTKYTTMPWFVAEPSRAPAPKRKLTKGQQVVSGAIAAGLVAGTLAAGAGLNWLAPDPDRAQRPFATSGEQGESLDLRAFTITVQTTRAVSTIQSGASTQDTQGAWVILRVRLTATGQPTPVSYAALRDGSGRTYLASDRLQQPLLDGKRTFQPGIPVEGEVVFEVPKESLTGLTALFAADAGHLSMAPMATVELPGLSILADQASATLGAAEVRP